MSAVTTLADRDHPAVGDTALLDTAVIDAAVITTAAIGTAVDDPTPGGLAVATRVPPRLHDATATATRPTSAQRLGRMALRLLGACVVLATVAVLVVELRHIDLRGAFAHIRWQYVGLAVLVRGLSIVAAAYNVLGFAPRRLRVGPTVSAQVAVGAVGIVTPSAMSTPAITARYLTRSGATTSEALASVGVGQSVQLLATIGLVAGCGVATGQGFVSSAGLPRLGLIAAIATVLIVGVWLSARRSVRVQRITHAAWESLRSVGSQIRSQPGRALAGIVGSVMLTVTHIAAFASCVAAAGGHASVMTLLTVYLASAAAGSIVPTPGGTGPVEAAMIAGLTVAGVPLAAATAATVLSRLISVWLLVPPGWFALLRLRRRGLL